MPPEKLRFLLDENVPIAVVAWLNEVRNSFEVFHVLQIGLNGRSDQEIYDWAQSQKAVVITFDEDFADLRAFPLTHHGVIRLRVWPTTVEETKDALQRLFDQTSDEEIRGALIVIDEAKIRIRRASR